MSAESAIFKGTVHGNMIRVEGDIGMPDGQQVTVIVRQQLPEGQGPGHLPPGEGIGRSAGARSDDPEGLDQHIRSVSQERRAQQDRHRKIPDPALWIDRIAFDPSISPDHRIVKGTRLDAEALVAEIEQGRSDEEFIASHPELSGEDVEALRAYAQIPAGFRLSFGAWAEDGDDLDRYVESVYERRRARQRRPVESPEP